MPTDNPAEFLIEITPDGWSVWTEQQRATALAAVMTAAHTTAEIHASRAGLQVLDKLPADDLPTSETLRKHRDRLRKVAEEAGRPADCEAFLGRWGYGSPRVYPYEAGTPIRLNLRTAGPYSLDAAIDKIGSYGPDDASGEWKAGNKTLNGPFPCAVCSKPATVRREDLGAMGEWRCEEHNDQVPPNGSPVDAFFSLACASCCRLLGDGEGVPVGVTLMCAYCAKRRAP